MINIRSMVESAFALPDRRPIYEWAKDNVYLPPVLTKTGPFDSSGSRHLEGPLDALKSDSVREVNVLAPVRSGKTLIADVSAPWAMANDNASLLWIFQTDQLANSHAETRAMPTLRSVPALANLMPDDRHKIRNNEILFANGLPFIICGPALGNLQSRGFKWVICDEPWLYKPGILEQAKARLGDFVKTSNSKLLCISQGGVEDDDWDRQFKSGELNEWHVQCAACGHYMLPKWTAHRSDGTRWGMMFDAQKDERGNYNIQRAIETIRFECEKCSHAHLDNAKTRGDWNTTGKFVAIGQPNVQRKSFHWTSIIDYPWAELLEMWLSARKAAQSGNFEPTIQFAQKRLAEPKSEKTVHEGSMPFARAEITEDKWDCEAARFITVDRQSEETYWLTARQWAKETGQSRRLLFKRCYSEAEIAKIVADIKPVKLQVMISGQPITILGVFIDSGYQPKGDAGVYSMCVRNGWAALKGTDEPFFWHSVSKKVGDRIQTDKIQRFHAPWTWGDPGEGTVTQGRKHAPLLRFASAPMSDRMQELIDRGLWIEPDNDSESELGREYDRQMTSEFRKKKVNKFTGKEELVWVCPSGNNHARDCGKMQVVAATLARLL